ncbi:DAK2 domain-containing protein [Arsenicicoccus dermatophilus]|uniref:DAK2 domain-containing protein n=1 Tax=Arsenicicoccus dermatophilus TaxID=1076331 RepID=UPI001F4D000D|nr:DAK2 domain-containing protein [Arsenicicoccus dermatophilus]MCH8612934.1 DAK2 domain-containing protein [Arsenicicoccus dermatophilus]
MSPRRPPAAPLDVLDGHALRRWAVRAQHALREEREAIDALNVYPVPDGDTGTNMFLTLDSAVAQTAVAGEEERLTVFARAAVLGARGNSGVIVSQLVRGLLDVLERPARSGGADAGVLARAFRRASDLAYAAVGEPAEGTILTVARSAAEAAEARARQAQATVAAVVDDALRAAEEALERTPDQLTPLRTAGVVDAGASGLVAVLGALQQVVHGHAPQQRPGPGGPASDLDYGVAHGEELPADCSGPRYEVVHVLHGGTADELRDLRGALGRLGDSVVVASAGALARVHAHVDDVEEAVRLAGAVGVVGDLVVTDLHAQVSEQRGARLRESGPVVLVHAEGRALRELYAGEGAVLTDEPHAAAAEHPGRDLLLLTGSHEGVEPLAELLRREGRRAEAVDAGSDLAALAALAVLDREAPLAEAAEGLREVVAAIRSGSVTTRATDPGALTPEGELPALVARAEDVEIATGDDPVELGLAVIAHLLASGGELVSLLGGTVEAAALRTLAARVQAEHPGVEAVAHEAGSPAYLLLVGVE